MSGKSHANQFVPQFPVCKMGEYFFSPTLYLFYLSKSKLFSAGIVHSCVCTAPSTIQPQSQLNPLSLSNHNDISAALLINYMSVLFSPLGSYLLLAEAALHFSQPSL